MGSGTSGKLDYHKAAKAKRAALAATGIAQQTATTPYSLSNKNVEDWLEEETGKYMSGINYHDDPPERITINNVPFKLMYQPTPATYDRDTDTFDTDVYYQSQIQATNGEWPVMVVTVEEKRKYYSKRQGGGVKSREFTISRKKSGLK